MVKSENAHQNYRFLEVADFLEMYRIGRTKFYAEVAAGRIQVKKLGSKTLIEINEAERWARTLPVHVVYTKK